MSEGPPPRPQSMADTEIGFVPQPMVCWLSPKGLATTGMQVLLSGIFGSYSDKRELQAALQRCDAFDHSEGEEIWIDYISDLGDGFEPTYHMAHLLAQEELAVERADGGDEGEVRLPAGEILVMGGDQVYPTASKVEYENRLIGPYRAALPWSYRGRHLYAIPGNHDWYDGLTSFIRVFCQNDWIGGWKTEQPRSYFALQLPHRWWLWGIDIQFDNYIDEPQLRYFSDIVGSRLQPGDSIILCSAKPSWVKCQLDQPEAFVNLDYFARKVISRRGAEVRLYLTGDTHHYAHYEPVDHDGPHFFTAGGGGAYLSATHHLPDELELPPPASRDPGKTAPSSRFRLKAAFPEKKASSRMRKGVLDLPIQNVSFWALVAALHITFGWLVASTLRGGGISIADRLQALSLHGLADVLFRSTLGVGALILLVIGLTTFTQKESPLKRWLLGGAHALVQFAVIVATMRVASLLLADLEGVAFWVPFFAFIGVIGGFVGSLLTGFYLYVADGFGCNSNELFAAQRIVDYKNFLRLRVSAEGVTVHPVGVDKTCRSWAVKTDGERHQPWFEPDGPYHPPRLIEEPVLVRPATPPGTPPSPPPSPSASSSQEASHP
ncbi:MAG: metallophosphoesterase [Actinomycetota bacterium]